jgi:DNA-binding CsgD family transcriptional regulator
MHWPLVGREAELARALRSIESGVGVALLGRTGVGKSRLLNELTSKVESFGMVTFKGVATESTRSVPFAPFAPLLPVSSVENRTEFFRQVLASMSELASDRGLLLAIDDAHLLDEGSLALVATVLSTGTATLCVTAPTGQSMHPDLVDLWTNGAIERVDIEPLDEPTTKLLIESAIGTIEPELMTRLWQMAQGNPLVIHEVVEGAVGRTIAKGEDGVWRLDGPLSESPRLGDLVRARTDQLEVQLKHSLELVAIGAPLPVEIMERASHVDLATLEATQLISVERSGDRLVVTPSHPLHGEVLVANLGRARRRQLYRELLAAAIELEGSVDDLQLAVWQRDTGTSEHPDVAVRGAVTALSRQDPVLAEELVGPIFGSSAHAGVILGRALNFQRRFEEAERVMSEVEADDGHTLVDLASARAHNLAFGLGRVAAAVELLENAAQRVDDDSARARLDVERGMISAIRGDFTQAESAGRAVLGNPSATVTARASGLVNLALSLAMTANCHGFDEIVADAYESAKAAKARVPLAEDQIGVMELSALCVAGRPEEALVVARRFRTRSSGSAFLSTWLDAATVGLDLTGQLRDGLESALEACELMAESDPFGLQLQARGLAALERGQLGDPRGRDDVEAIEFGLPDPRLSIWVDRGRVWSMVAAGAVDAAADLAAASGRSAIATQHYSWGGPAAHDAVRLGRPDLVVGELTQLRNEKGAHLLNAMADHAEALAAGSGDDLADAAQAFAAMSAWLLAAETGAQAAARLEGRQASLLACLSMCWELKCQDPRTPALTSRPNLVSPRELEVAMDAARGHTSPEIAERRYISVRTVDNHLRSVYRKLGIGGREELSSVLEPGLSP